MSATPTEKHRKITEKIYEIACSYIEKGTPFHEPVFRLLLEAFPAEPKWISVEERLPGTRDDCLVHRKDGLIRNDLFVRYEGGPIWMNSRSSDITHWMPLPPSPLEGKE